MPNNHQKIYEAALTEDSYLKNNTLLFKKIQESSDFSKITIEQKNVLLTFLNDLENIGSKSFEKLKLFKAKENNDVLSPLNNLISNNNTNIPKWLHHLIIDPKEECELHEDFQKLLIKHIDWLEKIYCNEELFNSITQHLTPDDLSDFYEHLVLLKKELSEDKMLSFNNIPWLFNINDNTFKLPSDVYGPDSLAKLNIEEYHSVSYVLKEVSEEFLPCYESLQILTPFKLGCKKDSFTAVYKESKSFNLNEINCFLNWISEKDFLQNFQITKDNDNYKLEKANDTYHYFTSNNDLILLIEQSELSDKLILLPKELYNEERTKIGLLDG